MRRGGSRAGASAWTASILTKIAPILVKITAILVKITAILVKIVAILVKIAAISVKIAAILVKIVAVLVKFVVALVEIAAILVDVGLVIVRVATIPAEAATIPDRRILKPMVFVGNRAPYSAKHTATTAERAAWERHRADFTATAQAALDVRETLTYIRHPGWTWNADTPAASAANAHQDR